MLNEPHRFASMAEDTKPLSLVKILRVLYFVAKCVFDNSLKFEF